MEPHVFAAVLAAAALHAGWNACLKLRIEPFLAMTLVTLGSALAATPFAIVFGLPKMASWPWLLASVALHLGYYVTLTAAYARADMGQVYPIARGGAPLVAALIGVTVLGEPITFWQGVGITTLGVGVMLVSLLGRRRGTAFDLKTLSLALGCALFISSYSLVDGLGARSAGDPVAYMASMTVMDGFPLFLFALWRRGFAAVVTPMRPYALQGLGGGAMSLAAYSIVVWAMTVAPIPLVAATRECSVLFAALISILLLKEPLQWPRVAAAVVIVMSLVIMRIG